MSNNEKVFDLFDQGLSAGKIAQKLKIKKAVVLDILGDAASTGLGDAVEKLTEATGIKAVVNAVASALDVDCRKEDLNKLFPNRKLNDLLTDQYEWLEDYFSTKKTSVNREQQLRLVEIYNHVFNSRRQVSNCSPCVVSVTNELRKIYNAARD